jgi:hypothetical protein
MQYRLQPATVSMRMFLIQFQLKTRMLQLYLQKWLQHPVAIAATSDWP